MSDGAASANTPADFGKDPEGVVKRWLRELELATEAEKDWRKEADAVVKRYRGDSKRDGDAQTSKAESYNLLYSNVQTIGPILYNSTPEPVVERRFDDDNPVATAASEVLRRAIKYTVGCQDFDEVISLAVQDYQLPGRAVVSVQYVPTMAPQQSPVGGAAQPGAVGAPAPAVPGAQQSTPAGDPGEEKTDELLYEEIRFDLTPWRSFRRGPGRTWQDVPWIAYELDLPRATCVRLFGEAIGNKIPLRAMQTGGDDKRPKEEVDKETLFNRGRIWQVWDKVERKVLWICPDYPEAPCKVSGDEYNLSGFFNVPRPLYAVETSDSLVPVPEFKLYETLANEAEVIVNRMAKLVRAIRVRGVYAADLPEIEKVMEASETALIACKNADEYREKGGLANAIWMMPLETLVAAYQSLSMQLVAVKGEIFEVLGIADVMRGSTDPQETMGAQAMKVRWGSLRTRRRQAEVQRFCRDLFNIAGELIAEKFSGQSLAMMTGLQYPTAQEKAMAQATLQQAQANPQMAQQAPPEMAAKVQKAASQPSWDEIVAFLRNDSMRHFRIDIQTDSTIALQDAEDQGDYAKMMTALAETIGQLQPMIMQGILPFEAGKAMILGIARKFRLGYEVEDKLSQMKAPTPPDPTKDPKILVAQITGEVKKDIEKTRAQADMAIEEHRLKVESELSAQKNSLEAQGKQLEALPNLITQALVAHIKNLGAIEVARINGAVDSGEALLAAESAAAARESAQAGIQ